jgi:translation initiation factor RLI1
LLNNKVTLELVNDIYRGVSSADVVDNLQLNIYNALIPFEGDVFTITIQASGTTTVSVVDNGYGIFSTVTPLIVKDNGFVTVTVSQNNGAIRTQNIRFTNNGIDTDFTLTQESKFTSIRFDSGIITFDNGFLTFDNN